MSNDQNNGCGCVTCLGWCMIIALMLCFGGAILGAIISLLPVVLAIFVIYVFSIGLAKIFKGK